MAQPPASPRRVAVTVRQPTADQFMPPLRVGAPYQFRLHRETFALPQGVPPGTLLRLDARPLPPWLALDGDSIKSTRAVPADPLSGNQDTVMVLANITATAVSSLGVALPGIAAATDALKIPLTRYSAPELRDPMIAQAARALGGRIEGPRVLTTPDTRERVLYLPASGGAAGVLEARLAQSTFVNPPGVPVSVSYSLFDPDLLALPAWAMWNADSLALRIFPPATDEQATVSVLVLSASNVRGWSGGATDALTVKRGNRAPVKVAGVLESYNFNVAAGVELSGISIAGVSKLFEDPDSDPVWIDFNPAPGQLPLGQDTQIKLTNAGQFSASAGALTKPTVLRAAARDIVGARSSPVDLVVSVGSAAPMQVGRSCAASIANGNACATVDLVTLSAAKGRWEPPVGDFFPDLNGGALALAPIPGANADSVPSWLKLDGSTLVVSHSPATIPEGRYRVALIASAPSGSSAYAVLDLLTPAGGAAVAGKATPADAGSRSVVGITVAALGGVALLVALVALVLYYRPYDRKRLHSLASNFKGKGGSASGKKGDVDFAGSDKPSRSSFAGSATSLGIHSAPRPPSHAGRSSSMVSFSSRSRPTSVGPSQQRVNSHSYVAPKEPVPTMTSQLAAMTVIAANVPLPPASPNPEDAEQSKVASSAMSESALRTVQREGQVQAVDVDTGLQSFEASFVNHTTLIRSGSGRSQDSAKGKGFDAVEGALDKRKSATGPSLGSPGAPMPRQVHGTTQSLGQPRPPVRQELLRKCLARVEEGKASLDVASREADDEQVTPAGERKYAPAEAGTASLAAEPPSSNSAQAGSFDDAAAETTSNAVSDAASLAPGTSGMSELGKLLMAYEESEAQFQPGHAHREDVSFSPMSEGTLPRLASPNANSPNTLPILPPNMTVSTPPALSAAPQAMPPLKSPISPNATVMCDSAVVRNLVAYAGVPFQYVLTLPPLPAKSRISLAAKDLYTRVKAEISPLTQPESGSTVNGSFNHSFARTPSTEHHFPVTEGGRHTHRMTYPNPFVASLNAPDVMVGSVSEPATPVNPSTPAAAGGPGSGPLGMMLPQASMTEVKLSMPWLSSEVDAMRRSGVIRGTPLRSDIGQWCVEVVSRNDSTSAQHVSDSAMSLPEPSHDEHAHDVIIWKAVIRVLSR